MGKRDNKIVGTSGEKIAITYLKIKGYTILERNYVTSIGEIDIIASDDGTLVFIEVKTRAGEDMGLPGEAVNSFKQRKISTVASQYLKQKLLYGIESRFDVIEILLDSGEVKHTENAFDSFISI